MRFYDRTRFLCIAPLIQLDGKWHDKTQWYLQRGGRYREPFDTGLFPVYAVLRRMDAAMKEWAENGRRAREERINAAN